MSFLKKALITSWGGSPSWPNLNLITFQRLHLHIRSHWRFGFQIWILRRQKYSVYNAFLLLPPQPVLMSNLGKKTKYSLTRLLVCFGQTYPHWAPQNFSSLWWRSSPLQPLIRAWTPCCAGFVFISWTMLRGIRAEKNLKCSRNHIQEKNPHLVITSTCVLSRKSPNSHFPVFFFFML